MSSSVPALPSRGRRRRSTAANILENGRRRFEFGRPPQVLGRALRGLRAAAPPSGRLHVRGVHDGLRRADDRRPRRAQRVGTSAGRVRVREAGPAHEALHGLDDVEALHLSRKQGQDPVRHGADGRRHGHADSSGGAPDVVRGVFGKHGSPLAGHAVDGGARVPDAAGLLHAISLRDRATHRRLALSSRLRVATPAPRHPAVARLRVVPHADLLRLPDGVADDLPALRVRLRLRPGRRVPAPARCFIRRGDFAAAVRFRPSHGGWRGFVRRGDAAAAGAVSSAATRRQRARFRPSRRRCGGSPTLSADPRRRPLAESSA